MKVERWIYQAGDVPAFGHDEAEARTLAADSAQASEQPVTLYRVTIEPVATVTAKRVVQSHWQPLNEVAPAVAPTPTPEPTPAPAVTPAPVATPEPPKQEQPAKRGWGLPWN